MFKVLKPANPKFVKEFVTMEEAQEYVKKAKQKKGTFTIEEKVDVSEVAKQALAPVKRKLIKFNAKSRDWKENTDFSTAVQITRKNVHQSYGKAGFIRVTNEQGDVLHVGRTHNMGKVFSNYVNCARYMQSYDFNLDGTDKLFFKEADI